MDLGTELPDPISLLRLGLAQSFGNDRASVYSRKPILNRSDWESTSRSKYCVAAHSMFVECSCKAYSLLCDKLVINCE
jgi:hypothetical protein